MCVTHQMRIQSFLLFLGFMLLGTSRALATPPPPIYVELTRAAMQSRQFTFKIRTSDTSSTIGLNFPKRLLENESWLVPYSTYVVVKNKTGDVIASTDNWVANNGVPSIFTSYNHMMSDVSVSITYACASTGRNECDGPITFRISSVSQFMDANPDAVNLPPKCTKVPGSIIETFDCTQ